ncbi:MAG: hypothetical protein ACHQUC_03625 [Chlamydiales bacterium]
MINFFNNKQHSVLHQTVSEFIELEYAETQVTDAQKAQIKSTVFEILHFKGHLPVKEWGKNTVLKEELLSAAKDLLVSKETPWQPKEKEYTRLAQLVFEILRGRPPTLKQMLQETSILKAVAWKKDPELLSEARAMIEEIFNDIAIDLTEQELSPEESFHMEAIIGDLLALYPFLRPVDGNALNVPLKIDGKWQLVKYHVEKIELTPKWMGSPIVAYGLNPQEKASSPPILLFKGTTYPTDKGFSLSLLTDINPFATVGSYAFSLGKEKIKKWLDLQTKEENRALIFGKSLGGAHSWRTALHFPDQVAKVMAYGAPGFSSNELNKLGKRLESHSSSPEINLFCQKNDPVPFFDRAAEKGVNYYELLSGSPFDGVLAHAHMYSTHETSTIIRNEAFHKKHKWKRIVLSLLRATVSMVAFPVFLSLHVIYQAIKQTVKLIKKAVMLLFKTDSHNRQKKDHPVSLSMDVNGR